jgi:hypothetical protein
MRLIKIRGLRVVLMGMTATAVAVLLAPSAVNAGSTPGWAVGIPDTQGFQTPRDSPRSPVEQGARISLAGQRLGELRRTFGHIQATNRSVSDCLYARPAETSVPGNP